MPHHSRPRDGHRERAWNDRIRERDRHEERSRYRYHRYSEEDEEEQSYDDDDVFDDRRRRRRTHRSSHSRPRAYAPHDDVYDNDDDLADDGDVIVVDSRPNFARPPNIRPSPARGPPDPRSRERSRHHKAKESPATSPIKKRDRERDREGRRRRDSTADDDSPTKARVRDRRTRDRDRDRDRERERDRDRGGGIGDRERRRDRRREKEKHTSADSANSATQLLSTDALSRFNAKQQKIDEAERARAEKEEKARVKKEARRKREYGMNEKVRGRESSRERDKRKAAKRRLVSGAFLEEGRSPELNKRRGGGRRKEERWRKGAGVGGGGGDDSGDEDGGGCGGWFRNWSKKKKIWVAVGVLALLLVIIIPVAAVVAGKKDGDGGGDDSTGDATSKSGDKSGLDSIDRDSIPKKAQGTVLDPWTWYETTDFNVTYTDETVGGLSVMGLNSEWDDSARANDNVPPLNKDFPYGKQPIRGVNVGGWLSIEPFIAPSLFSQFSSRDGVVDEWTLCERLGAAASATLEKHYATFITELSFKEIRDAGLDHVRIPFSYWAVKIYDGDPYVAQVSWRYLLRAIEYCRKYGLRVKLDLHGLPGSQNGWNHSGHQGPIAWLNGTDGDVNAQRAQDIHSQLSTFFAQDRYKNIVTIYGLANEPMMLKLDIEDILNWNTQMIKKIRDNGFKQYIAFGDGFLLLSKWKTMMQDVDDHLLIDTHQYTIFNTGQIGIDHKGKIDIACDGWIDLIGGSNSGDNGWGPTICGEWSQADTDCAEYLNNVNTGSRWTGTLSGPDTKDEVLEPLCPTAKDGPPCSCDGANADPSQYSDDYKKFLQTYAEAQMYAFEQGYGWFYWTWDTESAAQWSYKKALAAGTLPAKAYEPAFKCGDTVPSFGDLPDYY